MSELANIGIMPQILAMEQFMLNHPKGIKELPAEHYHIEGVYVRSLFIPKDMILTGAIHNTEHISILAQGTIKVTNGTDSFEISAPHIMIDKPGVKRLGYAVTDCTFINVIRTDLTDVDEIENEVTSKDFDEYELKLIGRQ